MTDEFDPLEVSLYLDHLRAGVEKIDGCPLDSEQRREAARLAIRLACLSKRAQIEDVSA